MQNGDFINDLKLRNVVKNIFFWEFYDECKLKCLCQQGQILLCQLETQQALCSQISKLHARSFDKWEKRNSTNQIYEFYSKNKKKKLCEKEEERRLSLKSRIHANQRDT